MDSEPSIEGMVKEGSDEDLIVEDRSFALAGDDARVRGFVRNTAAHPQPVTVTVELYRGEDAEASVAEAKTNREGLDPGGGWQFTVMFTEVRGPDISRYTILTD